MICKTCGKEIQPQYSICPFCGSHNENATLDNTPKTNEEALQSTMQIPNIFNVPINNEIKDENKEIAVTQINTVNNTPMENITAPITNTFNGNEKVEVQSNSTTNDNVIATPIATNKPLNISEHLEDAKQTNATIDNNIKHNIHINNNLDMNTGGQISNLGVNNLGNKQETIIKQKKKKNGLYLLIIIIIALLLAGGMYLIYDKFINNKDEVKENNKISEEKKEETNVASSMTEYIGTYINEKTTIYIVARNTKEADLTIINGNNFNSLTVELDKNNKLYYDEDGNKLSIEKTNDGIKVTSSATDKASIYNSLTNTYTKKKFVSTNWTGIYTKDDITIAISEIDTKNLYLTITQDYSNYSYIINNYTNDKISHKSTFFDDVNTISIEKEKDGLKVVSTSTDPESLFSHASGNYKINK